MKTKLLGMVPAALLACGSQAPPAPAVAHGTPASASAEAQPEPEPAAAPDAASRRAAPAPEGGATVEAASPNEAAPQAPPPLPEGTTVLHIGDSFAGALGLDLNRELRGSGVKSVLKYETSSYIPTWASSKELEKYLWQYKPDLVLITLGANELEVPDPQERAPTIRRLVSRLGGRPCVWVAPPLWEGARDVLLPVIQQNCAPCVYMSNDDIAKGMGRARDKIHPSMEARKTWAAHVVDWLARHRTPEAERPWAIRTEP